MTISKHTTEGERLYSFDPMPANIKQIIRDTFGELMDGKSHSVWDVFSLTAPKYIGISCIGTLPIEMAGNLEKYYKLHLYVDTASVEYEVYSYNASAFTLPDTIAEMMATSSVMGGSVKTDDSYNPIELTTYYRKAGCTLSEYTALRELVSEPHPGGHIIAIKKIGEQLTFEEYGDA